MIMDDNTENDDYLEEALQMSEDEFTAQHRIEKGSPSNTNEPPEDLKSPIEKQLSTSHNDNDKNNASMSDRLAERFRFHDWYINVQQRLPYRARHLKAPTISHSFLLLDYPEDEVTAWLQLPDNMKFIIVKELTSWFDLYTTLDMLGLEVFEETLFYGMYLQEMEKHFAYERAVTEWGEETVYVSLDRAASASEVFREPNRRQPRSVDVEQILAPPYFITDTVSRRDINMARQFLLIRGFYPDTVDLAHWLGHKGIDRFVIEEPGHYDEVCEVGCLVGDKKPPPLPRRQRYKSPEVSMTDDAS